MVSLECENRQNISFIAISLSFEVGIIQHYSWIMFFSGKSYCNGKEPYDAIKFENLQGYACALEKCTVCHLTDLEGESPHIEAP
jgi:hypothetical protein